MLAEPEAGIGAQLSYLGGPARTVVVQFSTEEPTGFRSEVAERILDVASTWLLFPRYGGLPHFGLGEEDYQWAAVEFGPTERRLLAEYLSTRPMDFASPGLDLYALANDGQVLMIWDHHTEQDGLEVQLQRVDDAATLVASLCSFGSQLEVFSKTWGEGKADD